MTIYYPPLTEASVTTTAARLVAANGNRKKILIQAAAANTAIVRIYFMLDGASAVTTEKYLELATGGLYDPAPDECPSNLIWVQSASGTQTIRWTEV